jgi:tetratricopeptide (TPR) repeat protein
MRRPHHPQSILKHILQRILQRILFAALFALGLVGVDIAQAQAQAPQPLTPETSMQAGPESEGPVPGVEQEATSSPPSSPSAIAAAAYARGDWDTAIAQYRAMLAEGYVDPALFYNLGTAYARSDQKGKAVWMFMRALQLNPRDPSTRKNLALIAPDLGKQRALFPFPPLESLYRGLRLNEWAWIGGGGTLLAALGFALFLVMRPVDPRRRWLWRLAVVAAVLAAGGHAFAAARYYEEAVIARAVITDPETRPRSAPSEASEVYTFTLPPGTLIRVQNAGTDGWIKAIYGGSNEVFIRDSQYERL